jgi:hypothetical protein
VCLVAGASAVALDPTTGAVRWRTTFPSTAGARAFATGGGRPDLVVATDTATAVLDGATGRARRVLAGWRPLTDTTTHDRMPVLRPSRTDRPHQGVADLRRLVVMPLAEPRTDLPGSCRASRHLITCVTSGPAARTWRYAG